MGYQPSRSLDSFYIAGFQFWDGPEVLHELKPGVKLALVPEQDNPYDPSAIAIYHGGTKLGYVPSERNELIATMMFYGHANAFEIMVLQADPERSPWHQVRVSLRVRDAR